MGNRMTPKTQQTRNRQRAEIQRRRKQVLKRRIIVFTALIIAIIAGAILMKKLSPSKEQAKLDEYYGIQQEEQLAVVIDNEIKTAAGRLYDGQAYLEYSVVRDYLNGRIYVDTNENILLYTLSDGSIKAEVGSKDYTYLKENHSKEYVILKMEGNTAYVALAFVQEYTNIDFKLYEDPGRIVVTGSWGERTSATVKKDVKLRTGENIKSSILTEVSKKSKVTVLEQGKKWTKVCTEDGFVGYLKNSSLKDVKKETISRAFEEQTYSNISKDYTINMAWHAVSDRSVNNSVLKAIANTKGLTTISPTWFTVSDTDGHIRSLASSDYVNYAHQLGIEVWALVRDFDGGISSSAETLQLLSRTSSRTTLINQLVAEALKYNIDGINVDFEKVSKECGEHYLQFLRELSVKCRQNSIILSVDNYVPASYNAHYNLEEQGKVVDYVILMGYDEHHSESLESGPVASLSFVEKGIQDALKVVPNEKLMNAVPFYTRLWTEVPKTEEELKADEGTEAANYDVKVTSEAYRMKNALKPIEEAGAKIVIDPETNQNYAEWEADGATYKIWLEDEVALEAKLKLMKSYELAGLSAWKLENESPEVWDLILKYVN